MAEVKGGEYLDGVVAAVSRIGSLILTMGIISGLLLVVLYIQHFSADRSLYQVAFKIRDELVDKDALFKGMVAAIDKRSSPQEQHGGSQTPVSDTPLSPASQTAAPDRQIPEAKLQEELNWRCNGRESLGACRQGIVDERSEVRFRIARIDNEMHMVSLGRVKLPFLGYEIAVDDAAVVLGFFLVIFASVLLITVHHLSSVLEDEAILPKINENLLLLRARLVFIYVPIRKGFVSYLTLVTFFMPCLVMAVAAFDTASGLLKPEDFIHQSSYQTLVTQIVLLFSMMVFLSYVAIFLVRGWTQIGKVLDGTAIAANHR